MLIEIEIEIEIGEGEGEGDRETETERQREKEREEWGSQCHCCRSLIFFDPISVFFSASHSRSITRPLTHSLQLNDEYSDVKRDDLSKALWSIKKLHNHWPNRKSVLICLRTGRFLLPWSVKMQKIDRSRREPSSVMSSTKLGTEEPMLGRLVITLLLSATTLTTIPPEFMFIVESTEDPAYRAVSMLLSGLKDKVDAKIVVAGISTTRSQKIHSRLEWAVVGLEQGGIHQGSGNGVAGSSGTLGGNERLPGSVLLARERLLKRLRRMPPPSEQAWQEEVDRARQGQRDAEGKLSSLEAKVQKMRVEMASMKRDAEHYSRQVISASSLFIYLHMKSFTRINVLFLCLTKPRKISCFFFF